jgi:hypothetical protein
MAAVDALSQLHTALRAHARTDADQSMPWYALCLPTIALALTTTTTTTMTATATAAAGAGSRRRWRSCARGSRQG